MRRGKARGIGAPARHRRWVGFLSLDSTNPDTTAPRPAGHRRATPPACNNSRRVTGTTEWSRHVHRQWRPRRCRRGSRVERRPSTGTPPSPLLVHQVWQQTRREQIPCSNTDNTIEKDPKGFRWRARRGGAGRGRRQNNKTETDEKERRDSNPVSE